MMVSVRSAALAGIEVSAVRVEVSITRGTPMIQIVGLAHGAVREGRERIRSAASQLGLHVPGLRITVNLAPADVPKTGSAFDLPITLGILCAAGQIPAAALEGSLIVGELGLDGRLRSIRGALPIALHAAREPGIRRLVVPRENLREAASAEGIDVEGADSLAEVLASLDGGEPLPGRQSLEPEGRTAQAPALDMVQIRGQAAAKRALEIAAAGGHNLLLTGAPGAGKTSLARCLPGILPPLEPEEAVEVTAVHSVAGLLPPRAGLARRRPFRAPHHSISQAGLVGGGSPPRPGEVSLAHGGVLFLDELPEFGRPALEALRQPLEEGDIRIVRAAAAATFPARFVLVAAMNPCPCGFLGRSGRCRCGERAIERYRARISGPLLDRIDLRVAVPPVRWDELSVDTSAESSATVRARVVEARRRALARAVNAGRTNAGIPGAALEEACPLERPARALFASAVDRFGLSARGYHRTLRVARTIADLASESRLTEASVAEAIRYRSGAGRRSR